MKPTPLFNLPSKLTLVCLLFLAMTSACKKENSSLPDANPPVLKVTNATYQWGELSINKKEAYEVVNYNANTGKIDSISSTNSNGFTLNTIGFTYSANGILLNTEGKDSYELDNDGRVIAHSFQETQNGYDIINTQHFSYDNNGYLSKIALSTGFKNSTPVQYSTINYTIENGNYTKFTLSNTTDNLITREYIFSYNQSKPMFTSGALFVPTFANNTLSNLDKYLNYGRGSKNLLTSVGYKLINLNNTLSTGTFTATVETDNNHYLTELTLLGNTLTDMPSDNLSPLPRSITLSYGK